MWRTPPLACLVVALIRTARLTLRPVLPSDVDDVHSYASGPEVSLFQDWGPSTREQTVAWVAEAVAAAGTDRHPVAVVLDDKVIGTMEIRGEWRDRLLFAAVR